MEYIQLENNQKLFLNPLQKQLFELLKKEDQGLTRSDMVLKLNKPRTTVYDNLSVLMNKNIIKKSSKQLNKRGRPIVFFNLIKEINLEVI